jgi:Meiotically up-regulated gene 113
VNWLTRRLWEELDLGDSPLIDLHTRAATSDERAQADIEGLDVRDDVIYPDPSEGCISGHLGDFQLWRRPDWVAAEEEWWMAQGDGLYFIVGADRIKIGRSMDVRKRLRALQTGSPVDLKIMAWFPGCGPSEHDLHQRFSEYRRHGEWFEDVAGDISNTVERLRWWRPRNARDVREALEALNAA